MPELCGRSDIQNGVAAGNAVSLHLWMLWLQVPSRDTVHATNLHRRRSGDERAPPCCLLWDFPFWIVVRPVCLSVGHCGFDRRGSVAAPIHHAERQIRADIDWPAKRRAGRVMTVPTEDVLES